MEVQQEVCARDLSPGLQPLVTERAMLLSCKVYLMSSALRHAPLDDQTIDQFEPGRLQLRGLVH